MSNVRLTAQEEIVPQHYESWAIPLKAYATIDVRIPRQIRYGEATLLLDEAVQKMRAELAEYFAKTEIDTGRRT